MTIKPQKNLEKSKESQVESQSRDQQLQQNSVRGVNAHSHLNHRNVIDFDGHGQSPQRRGESFDDITNSRHRRSPHKASRSKREHKREREKTSTSNTPPLGHVYQSLAKCSSPRPTHSSATENVASTQSGVCGVGSPVSQNNMSPVDPTTADLINAVKETLSGYNSGDEHLTTKETVITPEEWKARDEQFSKMMSERGFILKDTEEDGACLFRAISQQIYGDEEMHDVIRQQTMDYIQQNREYFSQFVTEDINGYIKRKRKSNAHGNHIEIQAISEIYNRPVELYCYKSTPVNIFNSEQLKNGYPPLRLSYQHGSHYNAILDPYNATVGVGLGLAGYKPELQTKEAVSLSENLEIEQTMFEDKLKTTDWEATNEAIEEQIARESYIQWCRDNLKRNCNTNNTSTSTSCSTSGTSMGCSSTASGSATTSATITSAEVNTNINQGNKSCTITTPSHSSTSTCSSTTATSSSTLVTDNNYATLSSFQLLGKSGIGSNSPKECDSDDTDMSSTSSIDHQLGEKRGKKSKSCRKFGGSRRRKHIDVNLAHNLMQNTEAAEVATEINAKTEKENGPPSAKSPRRSTTPTKSLTLSSSPETVNRHVYVRNAPCTSKQAEESNDLPLSTFYQSLLESSYADDELFSEQLTESEMLQQAIKMSTIDFFEDQKRKLNI